MELHGIRAPSSFIAMRSRPAAHGRGPRPCAGDRARHLLTVAYGTLRGVVYGVIGAALAQASRAMFGYWLAGAPAPFLLGLPRARWSSFPADRRLSGCPQPSGCSGRARRRGAFSSCSGAPSWSATSTTLSDRCLSPGAVHCRCSSSSSASLAVRWRSASSASFSGR